MNSNEIMLKIIFDRWYGALKNCDTLINSLSDEQLLKEIAPNKNRGIYLLGHLIAVHDDMLKLLNLGEKMYPALQVPFIASADGAVAEIPSVKELRVFWTNQCESMKTKFDSLKAEEWLEKHTAVSEEDFKQEPHRNKLNIIVTRTTHLTYHTGQLALLK
jgi:hypothetical protein